MQQTQTLEGLNLKIQNNFKDNNIFYIKNNVGLIFFNLRITFMTKIHNNKNSTKTFKKKITFNWREWPMSKNRYRL